MVVLVVCVRAVVAFMSLIVFGVVFVRLHVVVGVLDMVCVGYGVCVCLCRGRGCGELRSVPAE